MFYKYWFVVDLRQKFTHTHIYYVPAPRVGALTDDARLTSVWRLKSLSVAYIRPKSRTERPRKTKIGTEVAQTTHVTGHHFQDQKVQGQLAGVGAYCGGLPHSLFIY